MKLTRTFVLAEAAVTFFVAGMTADAAPSKLSDLAESPYRHYLTGTSGPRPFIRYLRPAIGEGAVMLVTDRGPIMEITITCGDRHDGIISYSKIERLYCDSHLSCGNSFNAAVTQTCHQR